MARGCDQKFVQGKFNISKIIAANSQWKNSFYCIAKPTKSQVGLPALVVDSFCLLRRLSSALIDVDKMFGRVRICFGFLFVRAGVDFAPVSTRKQSVVS